MPPYFAHHLQKLALPLRVCGAKACQAAASCRACGKAAAQARRLRRHAKSPRSARLHQILLMRIAEKISPMNPVSHKGITGSEIALSRPGSDHLASACQRHMAQRVSLGIFSAPPPTRRQSGCPKVD
jgi:hypothetical protein